MLLELRYLQQLIDIARSNKKIIIYGADTEVKKVNQIIKYYNGKVAYIINASSSANSGSYIELIYEDVNEIYVVVVMEDYIQACNNLESIGLRQHVNYAVVHKDRHGNYFERFPLDVNIGYTYSVAETDSDLPGVTVFGDRNKEDAYVIVTLGGSTSDSQAFLWKSWSEFLYDKIAYEKSLNGGNVILYSAGVSGYRSSQELLKLERDILNLKPDMVVCFSGVNDTGDADYPYVQYYQCQIFDTLMQYQVADMNGSKTIPGYSCGFKKVGTNADNWVKHMRIMHAICQEYNITFHSFLQPMLGVKRGILSRSEREIVLNDDSNILDRTEEFIDQVRTNIKERHINYIHDIADLFDEYSDVYIDNCHVSEDGNRIIADKIHSIIVKQD